MAKKAAAKPLWKTRSEISETLPMKPKKKLRTKSAVKKANKFAARVGRETAR
jgi:hypothetical protein